MIITIFEDKDSKSLSPINQVRASFELRCGAFTNLERIQNNLSINDEIQFHVRNEIKDIIKERYPHITVNPDSFSPGVWLNGQAIWTKDHIQQITSGRTFTHRKQLLAMHNHETYSNVEIDSFMEKASAVSMEMDIPFFHHIWDPIFMQTEMITADAQDFMDYQSGTIHPSVVLENGDNIFIGKNSEIRPGVVLDASAGPIIIAENVYVDIGALIQGPVYIGPYCTINPGAKLRKNVTLGPMCKIGGEVEDVIFQGYDNKQHDGFLGHSYLGEWVNLGANTNNSDLKNNYGSIRIQIEEDEIETGLQFLGSIISDYVRTGISTMLNTGTVIGLGANVFGAGFQAKYIPPFQWGTDNKTELDKFFKTIETIKNRRGKSLGEPEKSLISKIYLDSV